MIDLPGMAFVSFYVFIVGVSNFSIYYLVRHTHGPFNVFYRLRQVVGYAYLEMYDDFDAIVDIVEEVPKTGFFGLMFDCPWCSSTWYCLMAFVPLYFYYHPLIVFFSTFVSVALMNVIYEKFTYES